MKKNIYWAVANALLLGLYLGFVLSLGFDNSYARIIGILFFLSLTLNLLFKYTKSSKQDL